MTQDKDQTEKRERLVFVYGTLKQGGTLHYPMERDGASFVGEARILNKDYVMRDLSAYPALQRVAAGSGTYIKGELYLIDDTVLTMLDRVENYPDFYNRESCTVWVDDQEFKAIVYYVKADNDKRKAVFASCPVIESGEWDAVTNKPVAGNGAVGDEDIYRPDDLSNDCAEAEGRDESVPWVNEDNSVEFEVEKGVYFSNEYGDHWGPFETIEEAVRSLAAGDIDLSGSNVLNCGFRMIRKDLTADELSDIDGLTNEVYVSAK